MGEDNQEQGVGGEKEEEGQFRVDEGWKESVAAEREHLREQQEQKQGGSAQQPPPRRPEALPKPDLRVFLAGLSTQTLAALGELENPITKKKGRDLREARYIIDTIEMLKQKTQGNLSEDEEQYLDGLLHDLRIRYVSAVQSGEAEEEGGAAESENAKGQ